MELRFKDLNEFIEHRKINKAIYGGMTYQEKRELKTHIYGIMKIKKDKKDLIWEYLNEPMESEDFIRISIIMKEYRRKHDKNSNRL